MEIVLEVLFTAAILILLLVFFGVPLESIISIAAAVLLGLVCLAILLFVIFFIGTDISLLFRKRAKGTFVRVDDSTRFEHAVYRIGETEYACSFPAESFGRKRIYHENQEYPLLISDSAKRHTAYDRHSLIVILLGNVFSAVFIAMLLMAGRVFLGLF